MTMRILLLLLLIAVGTDAHAQKRHERHAPRCGARDEPAMESFMLGEVVSLLTDDYWTATRAKARMSPTLPTAPRSALIDNDACEHLRKALEREVGKEGAELSGRFQLFFYTVGDYYAVYAKVKRDPTSELEVHQRHPMRIYTKAKKPRLLMTVYM